MAITQTTRFGLYRWSAGTDQFLRTQMDESHEAIETKAAGFEHGTSRPSAAAAYEGFFYYDTSTGLLSYCVDDGVGGHEWLDLISGTNPESVGSAKSAGTSKTWARLDHVHDIATDAVGTTQIADLAVTSDKLAAAAVIAGKIASGGINLAAQFATGVIDTAAIGDDQVTDAKLDSVTGINANLIKSKTGSTIEQAAIPTGIPNTKVTGLVEALDDLSDVTISGPSTGEVVKYTGAGWENSTVAQDIGDLGDVTITGVADNEVLAYDSGGDWINQTAAEAGLAVANHAHTHTHDVPVPLVFATEDNLSLVTGGSRLYVPFAATINSIKAAVGTAPTGASVIVDVNLNGTTVFTTQSNRPTIAAGGNVSTTYMPDITSVTADQYFTVDVDQIGSGTPGKDLTIILDLVRTISGSGAEPHTHTDGDDHLFPFSTTGTVALATGALRFYVPFNADIVGARASVGTAPTDADLIVDVNINGTTIYTTQGNRPTISDGTNDSGSWATPDVTSITSGQYLTVDVDQVGSTVTGSDLVVMVHLQTDVS